MSTDPSNRRPRIAFAWNVLEWGGAQMHMLGIARQLRGRLEFTAFVPENSSELLVRRFLEEGVAVEFLRHSDVTVAAKGFWPKIKRRVRKIRSEFEMVRRLIGPQFDLLHVELGPWQSLPALFVLGLRQPVFFTIHNRLPDVGPVRTLLWKVSFAIAAISSNLRGFTANNDAKESLRRYADKSFVEMLTVTEANVNGAEISSAALTWGERARIRQGLGIPDGSKVSVTVGQFIERKGTDVLLKVAKSLQGRDARWRFIWITNSVLDPSNLSGLGHEDSCAIRVLRMPEDVQTRLELLHIVGAADVFVLPSLVEGLPMALLEAMALGVPAVASEINGVPEAVIDGVTGTLVRPGDAEDLEAKLTNLAADRGRALGLAEAGRRKVLNEFEETAVAEKVFKEYMKAHGGK